MIDIAIFTTSRTHDSNVAFVTHCLKSSLQYKKLGSFNGKTYLEAYIRERQASVLLDVVVFVVVIVAVLRVVVILLLMK